MYDNYYDIKQFSRPHYDDHPQMSISDRAAQFSPFAALTGYDAAVDETARYTEIREELTEDEVNKLNDFIRSMSSLTCVVNELTVALAC